MWRLLILVGVVLAVGALGCRSAVRIAGLGERAVVGYDEPVTKTRSERIQYQRQQHDLISRQMVEDIDTFWMVDRPSRLSEWHVR